LRDKLGGLAKLHPKWVTSSKESDIISPILKHYKTSGQNNLTKRPHCHRTWTV